MNTQDIGSAIRKVEKYIETRTGPEPDTPARAVVVDGLKCCIHSPNGKSVSTDMPQSVGGTDTCNSPGWLLRAAIASCDATLLAMRAARQGIELDSIEVTVDAMSDGRGMFLDEGISPGSSEIRIQFDVRAQNATREQIEELVHWVTTHAPVGNDISRPVDLKISLQTE